MNHMGVGPALTGVEELRKFNGVELQKEFDLQWYATDFRMLDVQTGRWTQIDPLAEKFWSSSPYEGFASNPIFYADALGLEPDSFNVNSPIMHFTSKSYNPPANSSNNAAASLKVGVYSLGAIYDGDNNLIGFSAYNTVRGTLDYTLGANELGNFSRNADAYAGVAEGLDNLPYEGVKDYVNGLKTSDWDLALSGLGEQWANAMQDPDWWMQVGGAALGGMNSRTRPSNSLTSSQKKAIEGLEYQIKEHKLKLNLYKSNPNAFDNKGFLKSANPELQKKIIQSRIRSLENQIGTFQKDVKAIKDGTKEVLEKTK